MFHCSSKGGTRGGKALFDWENVKSDKYRESYLGHSLNAPIGRWQQNRDLRWYTKGGQVEDNIRNEKIRDEIRETKEQELEVFASILSQKYNAKDKRDTVNKEDIKSLLKADQFADLGFEAQGLGYSRTTWGVQPIGAVKETLDGTEVIEDRLADQNEPNHKIPVEGSSAEKSCSLEDKADTKSSEPIGHRNRKRPGSRHHHHKHRRSRSHVRLSSPPRSRDRTTSKTSRRSSVRDRRR